MRRWSNLSTRRRLECWGVVGIIICKGDIYFPFLDSCGRASREVGGTGMVGGGVKVGTKNSYFYDQSSTGHINS